MLKAAVSCLGEPLEAIRSKITEGRAAITEAKAEIAQAEAQVASGQKSLYEAEAELSKNKALATIEMSGAQTQMALGEAQLDQAQTQLDSTKDTTLENSDLKKILTAVMVKGILTAQNFSMPAGYITEEGKDYMIRVGDKFNSLEEI